MLGLLLLPLLDRLPLALEPEFLNGVPASLDHMEAIHHNLGAGEGIFYRSPHAVGEIHAYLAYHHPFFLRQFVKDAYKIADPRALYHGHYRARLPVPCLVGENGVQLSVQRGLVYAHAYADVVRQKHPFLSMVKLFPLVEITEPILVRPFEIPAVNPPVP